MVQVVCTWSIWQKMFPNGQQKTIGVTAFIAMTRRDFIAFMVEKAAKNQQLENCYIVTDDMPTQQYEVLTWLASNKMWIFHMLKRLRQLAANA